MDANALSAYFWWCAQFAVLFIMSHGFLVPKGFLMCLFMYLRQLIGVIWSVLKLKEKLMPMSMFMLAMTVRHDIAITPAAAVIQ